MSANRTPEFIKISIKYFKYVMVALFCLMGAGLLHTVMALDRVGKYQVYEIEFVAETIIENPFDIYLLKIELETPGGRKILHDGFFDGDGVGGQVGRVWKARVSPDEVGIWKWRTVPGDHSDAGLVGLSGSFECIESDDPGGIVQDGKYFRFKEGEPVFLQGNFLDFVDDLPSTHVFMSEMISDSVRSRILARQRDFHKANKINIYFANKGDYGGISVTPWVKTGSEYDLSKMDMAAWDRFDQYIVDIKNAGIFAELWFFADDSGFGRYAQVDKNRLFRYAMARTSAFNHTLFVIALEWQEGWSLESVRSSGSFIQDHNPWQRLLSVHSLPSMVPDSIKSFVSIMYQKIFKNIHHSRESWMAFIASQAGNGASPEQVNSLAIDINRNETIPHISEEFGILKNDSDARLMRNMWANFCGGAAGGGTGSNISNFINFLSQSRIPFQRMIPMNTLVTNAEENAFCLAEAGHHYLVFSQRGAFKLDVEGNGLTGCWYNPTHSGAKMENTFRVQPGISSFSPPDTTCEWVLWITDESNLNDGRVYQSSRKGVKVKRAFGNKG